MTLENSPREIVRNAGWRDKLMGFITFGKYGVKERVRLGLGVDLEEDFLATLAGSGINSKAAENVIKKARLVHVLERHIVKRRS